jgi:hypothetical protein
MNTGVVVGLNILNGVYDLIRVYVMHLREHIWVLIQAGYLTIYELFRCPISFCLHNTIRMFQSITTYLFNNIIIRVAK